MNLRDLYQDAHGEPGFWVLACVKHTKGISMDMNSLCINDRGMYIFDVYQHEVSELNISLRKDLSRFYFDDRFKDHSEVFLRNHSNIVRFNSAVSPGYEIPLLESGEEGDVHSMALCSHRETKEQW